MGSGVWREVRKGKEYGGRVGWEGGMEGWQERKGGLTRKFPSPSPLFVSFVARD